MDFSNEKIDEWVKTLLQTDKRFQGIQAYEWNDTVTKEEKHIQRIKKIAEAKIK